MAEIAYGSGDQTGLPPVNLPTFGEQAPRQPLRIVINKSPAPAGDGGWAPYAPQEQAQPQIDQQPAGAQQGQTNLAGWAPYTLQDQSAQPQQDGGVGGAINKGLANAVSFGTAPVIAGLSAASGDNTKQIEELSQQSLGNPDTGDVLAGAYISQPFIGAAKLIANALSSHPDQTVQDAYTKGREEALQNQTAAQQQHPWAYLGGQLVGSLAVPVGGGLGAASAVGRIGRSALAGGIAGAAYGAGDTASEGGSAGQIAGSAAGGLASGAALGALGGSAIEGVGHTAGKIASVVRGSRDVNAEAGSRVLTNLMRDAPQLARSMGDTAALKAGSEAATPMYLADFGGENTRALLRSAANTSPTARNLITEKLDSRYRQQADRFANWIRSKFGGGDKNADIETLQAMAEKQNEPAYAKAYRAGAKGVWSPELARLSGTPSIQQAISGAVAPMKDRGIIAGYKLPRSNPFVVNPQNGAMQLRVNKDGNTIIPELAFWDQIVRNLNGRIGELMRSGNDTRARDVIQLKNALTAELDKLVPSYKEARAGAALFFKAQDAVEAGSNFVSDATIHNAQAARVIAGMKPAERALFARGFASELAHKIEASGYRSDVLNSIFVNSPRATQRIKIALGDEGAKEFEALIRVEGFINKTRLALGNSTTVRQAHEAGMAGAGAVGIIESLHGSLNPAYIIAGAFVMGGRAAAKHIDDRVATRIAEMLMSDNPSIVSRGYKVIAGNPVMRDALRRANDITARQIVNYMRPSGVGAAALTIGEHLHSASAPEVPQGHEYQAGPNPGPEN